MRWKQGRRSSNIEDRRGSSGRAPRVSRKVGGGAILLALLAVFVFGEDPGQLLDLMGGDGQATVQQPASTSTGGPEDELADEGIQAAASVGDDRLQQAAGRRVHPESFTHGSSAQRVQWFRTGFNSGDAGQCDTFGEAGM